MTNNKNDLRTELTDALKSGKTDKARMYAELLLKDNTGSKPFSFINNSFEKCPEAQSDFYPLRIALLSSFSIDFIHSSLKSYGFINGIHIDIYQAGFSQYRQEILNPNSALYAFKPNVVILAVEGKHFAPDLYENYIDIGDKNINALFENIISDITNLAETFRKNSDATLLLHNFARPFQAALGIADGHNQQGQLQFIQKINITLQDLAKNNHGLFVIDYSGLIEQQGHEHWYDLKMEFYAQAPISQLMFPCLVSEYMKYLRALTGKTKKCLVLDLDNTLWGGVVGEDGVQGIKLGQQYPGNAYLAFQKQILSLSKRGIILAIASKNNLADIEEVFEINPNMVLKKDHFSCLEINWNPKSDSIVNIAKHLNIGLEHIVFVDDNPAECEQVREALPQVTVIPLGKHPEKFINALLSEGWFDNLSYSPEDRNRNQMYQQRSESQALLQNSASLEEFYYNLDMTLIFEKVNQQSLSRATQLTQKTNQFNLTTRRYTELEIGDRINDQNWFLITVQVKDRYGDNGIVGLLMAKKENDQLVIDTFLLSCRVIGRSIETAMLVFLANLASHLNVNNIIGEMIPTAKNAPVRDLYQQQGFLPLPEKNGFWSIPAKTANLNYPKWFKLFNNYDK